MELFKRFLGSFAQAFKPAAAEASPLLGQINCPAVFRTNRRFRPLETAAHNQRPAKCHCGGYTPSECICRAYIAQGAQA